jgi:hypothetical protein
LRVGGGGVFEGFKDDRVHVVNGVLGVAVFENEFRVAAHEVVGEMEKEPGELVAVLGDRGCKGKSAALEGKRVFDQFQIGVEGGFEESAWICFELVEGLGAVDAEPLALFAEGVFSEFGEGDFTGELDGGS